MDTKMEAVQESIKLALDAADAATDVTSEYNKVKKAHEKLEAKVKQIHKYTTIVFLSNPVSLNLSKTRPICASTKLVVA